LRWCVVAVCVEQHGVEVVDPRAGARGALGGEVVIDGVNQLKLRHLRQQIRREVEQVRRRARGHYGLQLRAHVRRVDSHDAHVRVLCGVARDEIPYDAVFGGVAPVQDGV